MMFGIVTQILSTNSLACGIIFAGPGAVDRESYSLWQHRVYWMLLCALSVIVFSLALLFLLRLIFILTNKIQSHRSKTHRRRETYAWAYDFLYRDDTEVMVMT